MHRVGALDGAMLALSTIGRGGAVFVAIALLFTVLRRRARDFVQVGLAIACASMLADSVIKPIVHRERPFVAAPQIAVIGERPKDPSFPSGHSTNAFAGAVALSALRARWRSSLVDARRGDRVSRVYLGVHYPGDVAGGALLGLVVGVAISAACSRLFESLRPAGRASRVRQRVAHEGRLVDLGEELGAGEGLQHGRDAVETQPSPGGDPVDRHRLARLQLRQQLLEPFPTSRRRNLTAACRPKRQRPCPRADAVPRGVARDRTSRAVANRCEPV